MTPAWKTVHRFAVPETPEYLAITAWGLQIRVVPTRPPRPALGIPTDIVTLEIVGCTGDSILQPPTPGEVIHVDVIDDLTDDVTLVSDELTGVLELVYELTSQEHDDVTAVSGVGGGNEGGSHGA